MDETVKELLSNVRVASPCAANWDDMSGTDSVRSCERCQHKVYNLSEMTAPEAADLLRKAEGRLCVRFYRRSDGTMMTKDCPVGAQAVRAQKRRRFGLIGLSMASVAGLAGATMQREVIMGSTSHASEVQPVEIIDAAPPATPAPPSEPQYVMGAMAVPASPEPKHEMGKLVRRLPEPQVVMGEAATPSEPRAVMGAPMIAPTAASNPSGDKTFLRDTPAEPTPPREDPFQKPDGIR